MNGTAAEATSASEPRLFSDRDFRDALGLFATGVVVVTGAGSIGCAGGDQSGYLGATISSFSSVSLDPPLILFRIAAFEGVRCLAVDRRLCR
jgi:flavin reductase (DIM6/NTAB) family NADH-FMN oxidoreductase RutF